MLVFDNAWGRERVQPQDEGLIVATLDELRRRFAHNDGLPFCEVLSESSIQAVLDDHKVEFRDRVFTPQVTIWGFLSQVLSEATVAAMRCRESSRIVPPMALRFVRPIRPATAQPGVAFSPACCPRWPGGRPRSYRQAPPTNGSGTVDPCLLSMVQASPCRTRQRIKRCIRSRPIKSRGSDFRSPE